MSIVNKCGECGAVISPDAPGGMCPRCLMGQGLTEIHEGSASGYGPESVVPSLEQMKKLFPQFDIIDIAGRGGMGVVYKARQPRLNRFVALKVLPLARVRREEFSQRFLREAQALASLSHPNIVTIYDFGEAGDLCYFVMEFVDGCDLREMLAERSLKPYDAMNIALVVSDALQYAHDHGVVHRDIKPGNILVDKSGKVKIADFGLAKILHQTGSDYPLTMTNESMGTPYYMAPEQRDPSRAVDRRADIYALGVIIYEMLTGEIPLGKFRLPSEKCGTNHRLDGLVLKALEADPDRRYQQAGEIKAEIEAIVCSGQLSGAGAGRVKIGPALMWAAVAAIVIGGLIFAALRSRKGRPPEDAVQFGDKCYRVFHENIGWQAARVKCERMGGHLAIVRNRDQDDFLASLSRSHVWLGATDHAKEGVWVWVDGTPVAYTNWDRGEPSNSRDLKTGETENFLMISKYGKWNDFSENCRVIDGYICEWDAGRAQVRNGSLTAEQLHVLLKRSNPRYNGKGIFTIKNGEVKEVGLLDTGVKDLSPLKGLRLTSLGINWTEVKDLSPLENMPLSSLDLTRSKAEDLAPLAGMPLKSLRIDGTGVRDLSPLKGMPLRYLDLSHTKVSGLEPLAGMPLRELHMNCTKVVDLAPLAGMPLTVIGMLDVPVKDLAPLEKCTELESVVVPVNIKNIEVLKRLSKLKMLNNKIPDEFWLERAAAVTNSTGVK